MNENLTKHQAHNKTRTLLKFVLDSDLDCDILPVRYYLCQYYKFCVGCPLSIGQIIKDLQTRCVLSPPTNSHKEIKKALKLIPKIREQQQEDH